jgi:hypothetical protein
MIATLILPFAFAFGELGFASVRGSRSVFNVYVFD